MRITGSITGTLMKAVTITALFICVSTQIFAQNNNPFIVTSPDGDITLRVEAGLKLQWSVQHKGQTIIEPSAISLRLEDGAVLGDNAAILSSNREEINTSFEAINYTRAVISDHCNQLTLNCRGDYGVNFRVYDEGVAYRFFTRRNGEIVIQYEEANFNFSEDYRALIPYLWDYRQGQIFNASFESLYDDIHLSQFAPDSLAFTPLMVDVGNSKKAVILEADMENYPGMFLVLNDTGKGFKSLFAPYPLEAEVQQGRLNYIPTQRADYIARVDGSRTFPWRIVIISEADKELLDIDIVQKLASPSRLTDISWIEPGQAAWDWWNGNNISHVDFRAGMNNEYFKYNIDFAAANGIEYIIMDGGWSPSGDLTTSSRNIDLQAIVDYGKQKDVGVFVWAYWYTVLQQMDEVFPTFEKMGVRGLKIDFIDRDDQFAVASLYDIAQKAAEHHLMVDYHGSFKPTGLQRTYPNVVGFEGVKGLENAKWVTDEDMPRYAVSIPFLRMMAGPMDYTPGGFRNANRRNFRPVNDMPMTQGTRCQQLAMYVMYEVPFQMLADNATIYMKEQECTDFITSVPTVFNDTVALDGEVGEFCAIARKSGDTWYVGAMSNWTQRDLTIDCSFLGSGTYRAVIFRDGINADRDATDYVKEERNVTSADKLTVHLSSGGGWAARIERVR